MAIAPELCLYISWRIAEGTDGWLAAGLPLEDATPEPRPEE
jgi:hypothetical protein